MVKMFGENKKRFWVTVSLFSLCITAFFGLSLRTKFLFPVEFINYRYFISAHSHFAFAGWVTVALMLLLIYELLPPALAEKKIYQVALWGAELSALGMAISFPFGGYTIVSTTFAIIFILVTYVFAFVFIRDLVRADVSPPVKVLAVFALVYMFVSSEGPWTLAYILGTNSTDSIMYRDAVYSFLHFQYNGFFTLSVFALFIHRASKYVGTPLDRNVSIFAWFMSVSVLPSLALALLWHPHSRFMEIAAALGCLLILLSLVWFLKIRRLIFDATLFSTSFGRTFWIFAMISFLIKMVLQTGTIIPSLGKAVFGLRPIIIGFLHLVFLGLVSFFILSRFIEGRYLRINLSFVRSALIVFSVGIFMNETVLFVQGMQLLTGSTLRIYAWLLWIAAIILFLGAVLIFLARLISAREEEGITPKALQS